jgi:methylase of polypeptide subunit release factors
MSKEFSILSSRIFLTYRRGTGALFRAKYCTIQKLHCSAVRGGDELVRELIDQAPSRLRPAGTLALEIGLGQSEALLSALAEKNYRDICSKNDYNGVTRFLFARYG